MRIRHLAHCTSALVLASWLALVGLVGPVTASAEVGGAQAGAEPRATTAQVSYPKYGQRNAAVWSLQKKLVEADMLRAQYRTGYFGDRTKAAVKKLQKKYGQSATGRVSAATMTALAKAVAAMTGPATWYHRETIGKSADGRNIVAYRAGEPGKPVVMVVATMHGEEDFGQYVARGLLEGQPIRDVDLWVVPVLNPDGLAKDRRWVAHKVDLNRNFPHRFIVRANSGPRAKSAKETGVIMTFLDRVNPRYLVSWHQPLNGVDSYAVKDKALMKRLSTGLKLPVRRLDCHGSCHGTMTGWFNKNHPGAAITVEYGASARSTKTMKVRDANAVLKAVGGRRG
jgi:protein MpaA